MKESCIINFDFLRFKCKIVSDIYVFNIYFKFIGVSYVDFVNRIMK